MRTHEYPAPKRILQSPSIDEAQRYKVIVDYLWTNAVARLRDNNTNQKYFQEVRKRLSELEVLQDTKELCSMLIKRMSASNLDHLNQK